MSEATLEIYTSCFNMPLSVFIEITLRGEHEKWGVTAENWEKIIGEYGEMSGDKIMSKILLVTKEVEFLRNRYNITQLIVRILSQTRDEAFIDLLRNKLDYNFKFDNLEDDLARVVSKSKSDLVKLKLAQSRLDELQASAGGETTTEADWSDELIALGKFMGYPVKAKDTLLSEYLSIKKQFRLYIEINKKR